MVRRNVPPEAGRCNVPSRRPECTEIRDQYLIVKNGELAGMGAHSYTKGSSTSGSEEAANFKN